MQPGVMPVKRRDFLRWVGLTAGASITAPLLMGASSPAAPVAGQAAPLSVKVGLLSPHSNAYSALAQRFVRGLKAGFASSGTKRQVDMAELQSGLWPSGAYERAQELVEAGVQLVVWPSDSPISAEIQALFEKKQITLLMSGVGANLPRVETDSPYIFHHTLGYWQAAWALGAWAAQNLGKRTWMAASLYDSGYDAHYAFRLGFEGAGGEVLGSNVTQRAKNDFPDAFRQIQAAKPDFVAALYCAQHAVEFLRAWAAAGIKLPLVGPGFLTSDELLPRLGSAAAGIYTALGWGSGLKSDKQAAFSAAYLRQTAAAPDPFSLLGYEAAGLIEAALRRYEGGQAASLSRAFENLRVDGPRGTLYMPAYPHLLTSPIYLRQVRASLSGYQNTVVANLEAPALSDGRVQEFRTSLKTGWSNPYLCF